MSLSPALMEHPHLSWWMVVGVSTAMAASSSAQWKQRILGTTAAWPATTGGQTRSHLTCRSKASSQTDVVRMLWAQTAAGLYNVCKPITSLKFQPFKYNPQQMVVLPWTGAWCPNQGCCSFVFSSVILFSVQFSVQCGFAWFSFIFIISFSLLKFSSYLIQGYLSRARFSTLKIGITIQTQYFVRVINIPVLINIWTSASSCLLCWHSWPNWQIPKPKTSLEQYILTIF